MRILSPGALTPSLMAEWARVAADSAEPNVFAQPWMVMAALSALDTAGAARLAMVDDEDGSMIGVMPVMTGHLAGRIKLAAVLDWSHANGFVSAIAIRCGHERRFWDQLLDAIAGFAPGARCLSISAVATDSPVLAGLSAAARDRATPLAIERRTVRAMFIPSPDADDYWRDAVRPKKRKELRRQWNRINELGQVSVDVLADGDDVTPWIDEFLTLEVSGWKGAAGSALDSQQTTRTFFRTAMEAAYAQQALCFIALRIDGRAIAMLIILIDGNAGFAFKTAYDEQLANLSPGVLLQREAMAIIRQRQLAWVDSCAAQGHPMIDSLWRERREMVQLSLPMPGLSNRLIHALTQSATATWHRIKAIGRTAPAAVNRGPNHR